MSRIDAAHDQIDEIGVVEHVGGQEVAAAHERQEEAEQVGIVLLAQSQVLHDARAEREIGGRESNSFVLFTRVVVVIVVVVFIIVVVVIRRVVLLLFARLWIGVRVVLILVLVIVVVVIVRR